MKTRSILKVAQLGAFMSALCIYSTWAVAEAGGGGGGIGGGGASGPEPSQWWFMGVSALILMGIALRQRTKSARTH